MCIDKNGKPLKGAAKTSNALKELRTATVEQLGMLALDLAPLMGGNPPDMQAMRSILGAISQVCLKDLKEKADLTLAGLIGEQLTDAAVEAVKSKDNDTKKEPEDTDVT